MSLRSACTFYFLHHKITLTESEGYLMVQENKSHRGEDLGASQRLSQGNGWQE
jgi:hypothetical protein